jgi:GH25 family lysozyme M1 (1,4-beta-N-acetylmuramidase)
LGRSKRESGSLSGLNSLGTGQTWPPIFNFRARPPAILWQLTDRCENTRQNPRFLPSFVHKSWRNPRRIHLICHIPANQPAVADLILCVGNKMRNPNSPFWPALIALWLAAGTAQALDISGQITDSTNGGVTFFGISGVTVSTGTNSAITDAGGSYAITNLASSFTGYVVTPAQSGVTFSPASRSFGILVANQSNVDFSVAHTISGQVTRSGFGLFGVQLTAGTNSASTGGDGSYTIAGLVAGEVTVIPSLSGYTFNPTNQPVAVGGNKTGINFTATPNGTTCDVGTTLAGVDVSVYQGPVDWPTVKASGVAFAFARVGDGTFLDTKFSANWTGIKAAGMVRGAYQFFEPGQDPVVQANIVIHATGILGPGDLPAVLDAEVTGGQSQATIITNMQTWIAYVQAGTGRVPMIYTAKGFWDGSVGSTAFSADPLWAANWGVACPSLAEGWTNWTFWQFADNGTVAGITNLVDLDRFNGSMSDLLALANEPGLNIAPNGGGVVSVTWSTYATGFLLQQNANLDTTNWVSVTNKPNVVSNQEQVILGTSNNPTFFRLFHP